MLLSARSTNAGVLRRSARPISRSAGPLSRRATVQVAAITKQDIIDRMAVEFDLTKVSAYVISRYLPPDSYEPMRNHGGVLVWAS